MQRLADRRPKFIFYRTVQQQIDAFPNPGKNVRATAGFRIALRAVLDVHRHIVKNAITKKPLQHSGIGAVGIQFYGVTKLAEFFKKPWQLRLQRRLSAGDADAVQLALPLLQKSKYL